ncbi:hypothetical protein ACO0SA_001518 [Hanseniaspora valbyensis]
MPPRKNYNQNAKSVYLNVYKQLLPHFEEVLSPKEQSMMIAKLIQYNKMVTSHNQKLAIKYRSVDKTPIIAVLLIYKELGEHSNADEIFDQFNEFGGMNVTPAMTRYLKNYLAEKLFGIKVDSLKAVARKDSLKGKSPDTVAKERSSRGITKNKQKAKLEEDMTEKWNLAKEHNSLSFLFSNVKNNNSAMENTEKEDEDEDDVRLVQNNDNISVENPTLSSKNWLEVPLKDVFAIAEVFNFDNNLTFLLVNAYLNLKTVFICKKKCLAALLTIISKNYYKQLIERNHNFERLIDLKLFSLFTCNIDDLKFCTNLALPYFTGSKFFYELVELTEEFNKQLTIQEKYLDHDTNNDVNEKTTTEGNIWATNFLAKVAEKKNLFQKQEQGIVEK